MTHRERARKWLDPVSQDGAWTLNLDSGIVPKGLIEFLAAEFAAVEEESRRPGLEYIVGAVNDFSEGRISAGKLAEILGARDVRAFKMRCHSFCDCEDEALKSKAEEVKHGD